MIRFILWLLGMALLCFAAALFQSTLLDALTIRNVKPDLLLCIAVVGGCSRNGERAAILGWMAGMARGLFSIQPLGLDAALFTLVAAATFELKHYLFAGHPVALFLLVMAGGTFCSLAREFWALCTSEWLWRGMSHAGFVSTIYTAAVAAAGSFVIQETLALVRMLKGVWSPS